MEGRVRASYFFRATATHSRMTTTPASTMMVMGTHWSFMAHVAGSMGATRNALHHDSSRP